MSFRTVRSPGSCEVVERLDRGELPPARGTRFRDARERPAQERAVEELRGDLLEHAVDLLLRATVVRGTRQSAAPHEQRVAARELREGAILQIFFALLS